MKSKYIYNKSICEFKLLRTLIAIICVFSLMIPNKLSLSKAYAENATQENITQEENTIVKDSKTENTSINEDNSKNVTVPLNEEKQSNNSNDTTKHTIILNTQDSQMGLVKDENDNCQEEYKFEVDDHSTYTYEPGANKGIWHFTTSDGTEKTFSPAANDGFKFEMWVDRRGETPESETGEVVDDMKFSIVWSSTAIVDDPTAFVFEDIAKDQGWSQGDKLNGNYTFEATKKDPELTSNPTVELVGNDNTYYDLQDKRQEKGIKFTGDSKESGGYIKIKQIEGYDISHVTLRMATERGSSTDVAGVIYDKVYNPVYGQDFYCFDLLCDYFYKWDFDPNYSYISLADFVFSTYRVEELNNPVYVSAIGVTYTKHIPKVKVSGKVVDVNGNPETDVIVSGLVSNGQTENATAKTDEEGKWSLEINESDKATFVFTKTGFYESSISADLTGKTEFEFSEPFVLNNGVTCSFESSEDLGHKDFFVETYINHEKNGESIVKIDSSVMGENTTFSLNDKNSLHFEYTDLNNQNFKEKVYTGMPIEGYSFDYWTFSNDKVKDQIITSDDKINIKKDDGAYTFVPHYNNAEFASINFSIDGQGEAKWDKDSINVPVGSTFKASWDSTKMTDGKVEFYDTNNELIDTVTIHPEAAAHNHTWIKNIDPAEGVVHDNTSITASIVKMYQLWVSYQDFDHPEHELAPKIEQWMELGEQFSVQSPAINHWIIADPSMEIVAGSMEEGGHWYQVGYKQFRTTEEIHGLVDWSFGYKWENDKQITDSEYLDVTSSAYEGQPAPQLLVNGDADTRMFGGELRLNKNSTNGNTFIVPVPEGYKITSLSITARSIYDGNNYNILVNSEDIHEQFSQTVNKYMFDDFYFTPAENESWTHDINISFDGFDDEYDEAGIFNIGVNYAPVPVASHTLTINYIDLDSHNKLQDSFVKDYAEGEVYSVKSPVIENYELANPEQAIIEGTMQQSDVNIDVAYKIQTAPSPVPPEPTPAPASAPTADQENVNNIAQTGDSVNIYAIIGVSFVALLSCAYVFRKRKLIK